MAQFSIKGIVEGFYGTPWTMEARLRILEEMRRIGMNLYVYAPKNDLLHRHQWETPYPKEFMDSFGRLVGFGKENGIGVSMAVSPGLTLTYSDNDKINALVRKYLTFSVIGVKDFCLFLDDIPPDLQDEKDRREFAGLPEAQAFFTNQVYERLYSQATVTSFFFCPTQYRGDSDTPYLHCLGNNLNPAIDVLWTGPEVCSKEIPYEDGENVSGVLNRKIVYWDNYPVNDGSMIPELHVGPYTGRDKRLAEVSKGFLINPMNQAYASIPVLYAIARYLDKPDTYDPNIAWESAIAEYAPECTQSLRLFAKMNLMSPLNREGEGNVVDVWLKESMVLFQSGKPREAIAFLIEKAHAMQEASLTLKSTMSLNWLTDVRPWLSEFENWGTILLGAAQLAGKNAIFYQEKLEKAKVQEIRDSLASLKKKVKEMVDQKTCCTGNSIRNYAMKVILITDALLGYRTSD
jgi:hyaluronoglucosaminidase